ncbi:MAG: CRISPR system precrRNA processing endoribonuclease RAMP protein Cas6 [Armatimonadota bacterium]
MLAAIDLRLYPKTDASLPHPSGHLMHAALLEAVRTVDPCLSAQLHKDSQLKPLAVSTLWSRARASGDSLNIPKYTECRVRICTLTRPVFEAVSAAIFPMVASNRSIRLGNCEFTLLDIGLESPYGGVCNYSDLCGKPRREVMIRFTSPVTFRRSGLNIPLPDQSLVYQSLWQKWRTFSDQLMPEHLFADMMSVLAVNALDGHTRVWKFPRYKITGFVGLVGYELVRPVGPDVMALFGALSEFAFYAGVGYKTTMGMGQCRIIEREFVESEGDASDKSCEGDD